MSGTHRSGRRPKALSEHQIRGTFQPSRHAGLGEPPAVPIGAVVKPTNLSAKAGGVWDELAPIALAMGTLTAADVRAFTILCELQGSFDTVCALKDSDPAKFSAKLERDYAAALRPYAGAFGFDPASRARLHVPPAPTTSPLDKFLRPRPVSKWT